MVRFRLARKPGAVLIAAMPTQPPFPIAMGQRTLAAIVFTDVVGYSARMQKEEEGTLSLLEQDFTTMKEFSDGLSGTILKSTGDGLLIYFASAVNAVTWAVKTQRHFAERAQVELLTKILRHRVGVHVGDVFRTEDDVVGDGVNIAARVQAEAPTGGVCISQTAYDMVKTKMEIHVARLSSRQLKNISEPVPIYQVLLDGPEVVLRDLPGATAPEAALDPATRQRRLLMALVIVAGLGGAGFAMFRIYRGHEQRMAESAATQAALGHALIGTASRPVSIAPAVVAKKTNGPDFVRKTTSLPADPAKDAALFAQATESVAVLEQWVQTQLPAYTRNHPLLVRDLDGGAQEWTLYVDPQRRLSLAQNGAARPYPWDEISPDKQAAIIVSLLRDPSGPVSDSVQRGAEAFAYLHGLPEMTSALLRNRGARTPP